MNERSLNDRSSVSKDTTMMLLAFMHSNLFELLSADRTQENNSRSISDSHAYCIS